MWAGTRRELMPADSILAAHLITIRIARFTIQLANGGSIRSASAVPRISLHTKQIECEKQ